MKWTSANYAANIVSAIHAPTQTQRYTPFIYKLDLILVINEIVIYAPITLIAMDLHKISLHARAGAHTYVCVCICKANYLHAAESFVRNQQSLNYSRNSQHLWNRKFQYGVYKSLLYLISQARLIQSTFSCPIS